MVELLAPAGSMEALIAAVESGANAVYLAGNAFGARAYANNFDEAALKQAINFAHLRGVLINVTVNTIVDDEEIPALKKYLKFLAAAGADAVLVQDLGVAKIAQETVPLLPLHASTQMTVHNLAGVLALAKLGFTRVVLSRELSLKEIRYICQNSPIEIEVFMHGALCVCYSGQCLMSSMIGGRSGNRGRCAQPCRLPYTLATAANDDVLAGKAGQYLLSPRDLNTIDVLPELIAAGVASLKIEGRMKRPEYVATVVSTYRQAIDTYYTDNGYQVTVEERNNLAQIFNRDFTTAYLCNRPGKTMMSDRRPNNRGLLIGRVQAYDWDKRLVTVKLSGSLSIGDQVDFWVKVGGRVTATIQTMTDAKANNNIEKAAAGAVVTFAIPAAVREHDRVFKVYDAELMTRAKAMYNTGAPVRRIPVTVQVKAAVGEKLMVTMTDNEGNTAQGATDFVGEAARKRPLSAEVVAKQINRMGTSVYEICDLAIDIDGNVMVPMSEINEARRLAVEALNALRLAELKAKRVIPKLDYVPEPAITTIKPAKLMVSVASISQLKAAIAGGADGILYGGESYEHRVITPAEYEQAAAIARQHKVRFDVNLPRIIKENEQKGLEKLLAVCKDSIRPVTIHVHNIGAWYLVKQLTDLPIHADYSLIAYNSETLQAFNDLGIAEATISPELNLSQIKKLSAGKLPLSCIIHGRLELMVSEYCPLGSFIGGIDKGACIKPCEKQSFYLKDRKNAKFPLVTDQFCRTHILNSKVLSMLPMVNEFKAIGISTLQIEAKAMTEAEICQTVSEYVKAMSIKAPLTKEQENYFRKQEGKDITRGHYYRGVL